METEYRCRRPINHLERLGTNHHMNFQEDKKIISRSLASLIKERDLFSPDMSCKQFTLFGQSSTQKTCFPSKDLSGELLTATIKDEHLNDVSKEIIVSETILSSEMVHHKSEFTQSPNRPISYAGAVLQCHESLL